MSYQQDQDIILLLESPAGYNLAFDFIVERYHRKIYHHVRRFVIDHDDSADVVQEVFIKIWKNLASFRRDAAVYTWIYRIASNEALNFVKSRNRRKQLPELLSKEASFPVKEGPHTPDGEQILQKLLKVVSSLPEKQQLVFHLKYFEDLPYDDIAQITGTSVGALKASYHFARKKIEEEMTAD